MISIVDDDWSSDDDGYDIGLSGSECGSGDDEDIFMTEEELRADTENAQVELSNPGAAVQTMAGGAGHRSTVSLVVPTATPNRRGGWVGDLPSTDLGLSGRDGKNCYTGPHQKGRTTAEPLEKDATSPKWWFKQFFDDDMIEQVLSQTGESLFVKFHERSRATKPVKFLSTFHTTVTKENTRRRKAVEVDPDDPKKAKAGTGKYRRIEIDDEVINVSKFYNYNMNGVDVHDQYRGYNYVGRRSRKWWKSIGFYFILDAAICNAYISYKEYCRRQQDEGNTQARSWKVMSHEDFRVQLAHQLLDGDGKKRSSHGGARTSPAKGAGHEARKVFAVREDETRAHHVIVPAPNTLACKSKASEVEARGKIDMAEAMKVLKPQQRDCAYERCMRKDNDMGMSGPQAAFKCAACEVHLHPECFAAYHGYLVKAQYCPGVPDNVKDAAPKQLFKPKKINVEPRRAQNAPKKKSKSHANKKQRQARKRNKNR